MDLKYSLILYYLALISKAQSQDSSCTNVGDIRLVGDSTGLEREGRVEVCFNGVWGTVCGNRMFLDSASLNETLYVFAIGTVVCRQLGLAFDDIRGMVTTQRTDPPTGSFTGPGEPVPSVIHFAEVRCSGDERGIVECNYSETLNDSCTPEDNIGIICSSPECIENSVRLVDGDSYNSGRVEMCFKFRWNTVHMLENFKPVANVICRQLGFSDTGNTVQSYGGGFGNVLNLACLGNETQFSQCKLSLSQTGNYNHSSDLGVVCERCSSCDCCEACSTMSSTTQAMATTAATTQLVKTSPTGPISSTTQRDPLDLTTNNEATISATTLTATNDPDRIINNVACSPVLVIALGVLSGILLVLLLAVTVGWITTCLLVRANRKAGYNVTSVPTNEETEETAGFKNPLYTSPSDGYATIGSAPVTENERSQNAPMDMSGDFIYNESYGRAHQCGKLENSDLAHSPESVQDHDPTYTYVSTSQFKHSVKTDSSTASNSETGGTLPAAGDIAQSEKQSGDYGVLDQNISVSEEPVESHPRKSKVIASEDEYSKLER